MDNIARFIDFDFKYKWRSILGNVVILSLFSLTLLAIGELIRSWKFTPRFVAESPEPIRVANFFLWLILLWGLWRLCWEKIDNKRLLKDEKYVFKHTDWPDKWIFNGKTETTSIIDELYVKSSRAGCLLKTHIWRNFRMTFEMKFEKGLENYVGIVFRADNLDNYFMLEVFKENGGSSNGETNWKPGIKPHIRYKGGWEIIYREIHREFDFSDFEEVVLEVKDDTVSFFYKQQPIFKWVLPTHVDVNHIEAGFKQSEDQKGIPGKEVAGNVREIPFRLNYGMVGFRAHPSQGAIIRDLKVEPL